MRLKVAVANGLNADIPEFDVAVCTAVGTNTNVANLTDWDTSSPTDIVLETITPFTNSAALTSNYAVGTFGGWEERVWGRFNYSDASVPDPAAVIRLKSTTATPTLVPGNWVKVRLGGAWGDDARDVLYTANGLSATYNNITQSTPYVPPDPVEIIAQITDDGTGKGVIDITSDYAPGSTRNYLAAIEVLDDPGPSAPTISNVDGDNAVNQYQQALVNVTDFTETITSATLDGVACTIPENDPTDDQVTIGMPGSLDAGTYDFVISGATETDTISGISYTVTHEFTAPYEPVDSNSLFAGQLLTSDSYHRIVTPPANGTLDTATAEAQSLWGNDVDDIYTPDEGFTGDDTVTLEVLYADGTTAQWTATIAVAAQVDTTPDAFTFTDQVDVEPDSVDESNAITITGVDAGEDIAVTITGGEYAVSTDGGSSFGGWTSTGSNVQLNYQIKVRNTASSNFETAVDTTLTAGGVSDTFTRTTRAAVLPVLDTPIPDLNLGETDAVSVDLDDHFTGASSYTLTGIPASSGLSFSGSILSGNVNKDDIAASPFNLTATAFSADGSVQDVFEVTVVDDIAPVISIDDLTTTNTSPVVTGSAGDAANLTLVVTGVGTYNPAPSGGTWGQQLPTLAIGDYPMTLNGQDAAGNPAVEQSALLKIVDEVVSVQGGLFRPLFKPATRSVNKPLFR